MVTQIKQEEKKTSWDILTEERKRRHIGNSQDWNFSQQRPIIGALIRAKG